VDNYSAEFKYWYERVFLQSPSMSKLEYDDEKMWEAWKAGYKLATLIHDNHILTSSSKGLK
jgi:hypothetical protein